MTSYKDLSATVFIPTFNGEELLDEVLGSLSNQILPFPYEIFIIDSGSTDRTLEIIGSYPKVRLHEIPNDEFGHGKTRNLAAQMSSSTFMVYITQDAVPIDKMWLHHVLEPFFIDDQVVAVLGKQIPWPNCNSTVKREVSDAFNNFGSDKALSLYRHRSLLDNKSTVQTSSFLSDVNAAYRRNLIVNRLPFKEVGYAEDQAMGQAILDNNLVMAYAPLGAVKHSHNFSVREYFYRKYDEYTGLKESLDAKLEISVAAIVLGTIKATLNDYRFIVRDRDYSINEKLSQLIKSPGYNLASRLAIHMAGRSKTKNRKFSLESRNKNR